MTRRLLLPTLALSALLAQPVRAQVDEATRPEPKKPFAAFSASAQGLRDSVISRARSAIGTRYVLGGNTPGRGIDCSGLVKFVMSALHLDLPRTADTQARVGEPVAKDIAALQPGDILTFGSAKRTSHVGIYVGDGRFVHASTTRKRVIESRLDNRGSSLIKRWSGVRRLMPKVVDSLLAERDSTP
ncbi:MAG: C40 family peptidase [Gemmatimonadaceae bacterium]|jgi:cell wall-associated NlpC family hydrolase|nr:C40 family peptidase [Gemmatimonadaceae bacterium]